MIISTVCLIYGFVLFAIAVWAVIPAIFCSAICMVIIIVICTSPIIWPPFVILAMLLSIPEFSPILCTLLPIIPALGAPIVPFLGAVTRIAKKTEPKKEMPPEELIKKEMPSEVLPKKAPKLSGPGPILLGGLALSVVIIGILLKR